MPTSQGQVIRLVAESHPRTFMVFLGAGASKSSGVPLASEMVQEWRKVAYDDEGVTDVPFDAWCATKKDQWFGKDDEYSLLFEALFPNEWARQEYIEKKVANVSPSWGYLYLANLMERNYFNVCLTTNFDDLLHQACSTYVAYNPVVCAFDSEVMNVSLTSPRAKIIKLHGDYLFKKLRNTKEELMQLDPQIQQTWEDLAKLNGMVVLGYNGNDISVMSVIERCLQKGNPFFDHGIYWGVRKGSPPSKTVQDLAQRYPRCFLVFEFDDFDTFFAKLHATVAAQHPECGISLPKPVLEPYEALKERYALLTRTESATAKTDPMIDRDRQELLRNLSLPWAQADRSKLDLLQAQLALGQRDYPGALKSLADYTSLQTNDIDGLTTWGYALAMKAEEERADDVWQQAIDKWKAATALEGTGPVALQARYGLIRAYGQRQRTAEAIAECESLLKLVPLERSVREQLSILLANAGRFTDAIAQLDQLLARYPDNAMYRASRANLLDQKGSVEEAREELKRAIDLDSKNAYLHVGMAGLCFKLARMDDATQELEEAARLAPDMLSIRLQLANLYSTRGNFLAALPHVEKAVAIEPGSAESRGWLGQTYLLLGRIPDAQRELQEMLRLSPNDLRAEVMAGVAFLKMRLNNLAEQHLQAATRIAPRDSRAWFFLGLLYRSQERYQEVAQVSQLLAQMDPNAAQMLQSQLFNWPASAAALFGPPAGPGIPFAAPQFPPQNAPAVTGQPPQWPNQPAAPWQPPQQALNPQWPGAAQPAWPPPQQWNAAAAGQATSAPNPAANNLFASWRSFLDKLS